MNGQEIMDVVDIMLVIAAIGGLLFVAIHWSLSR